MQELQQLVETAKQAVPGVDAAIAAAIERKLNPVGRLCMQACQAVCCPLLAITTLHLVHYILCCTAQTLIAVFLSLTQQCHTMSCVRVLSMLLTDKLTSCPLTMPMGVDPVAPSCASHADIPVLLCSLPPSGSPSWVPSTSTCMGLCQLQSHPSLSLLPQPSEPGALTRNPGAPGRAQSAPSASAKATPSAEKQPLPAAGQIGPVVPLPRGQPAKPVCQMMSCPTS